MNNYIIKLHTFLTERHNSGMILSNKYKTKNGKLCNNQSGRPTHVPRC